MTVAAEPARRKPGSPTAVNAISSPKDLAVLTEGVGVWRALPRPGTQVCGLAIDSRRVQAGDVFVCLAGRQVDGHRFAAAAVAQGAVAVVTQQGSAVPGVTDVACLEVDDTALALARLSTRLFDHPSHALKVIGVTGTNGKTTVTYMVQAALEAAGLATAVLGTTGVGRGAGRTPLPYTTPTAPLFQRTLASLRDDGHRAVACEVSSHGLATHRTWGTRFGAVAFTNLSRDHLDFHGTEEAYLEAKLRLFDRAARGDRSAVPAVVNVADPRGQAFVERARSSGDSVVTVSRTGGADLSVTDLELSATGTRGTLVTAAERWPFELAVTGLFNVENALVALGLARLVGCPLPAALAGIKGLNNVPGRLERVGAAGGVTVYVDFAHTPDALRNVLTALRPLTPGRLIAVFGCGGDRDRGKRPAMAAAGVELADQVILTSDNPRTEPAAAILDDMLAGVPEAAAVEALPDRRAAIRRAVAVAAAGDTVVIAGKGHETSQLIGDQRRPFDDRVEGAQALAERFGVGP